MSVCEQAPPEITRGRRYVLFVRVLSDRTLVVEQPLAELVASGVLTVLSASNSTSIRGRVTLRSAAARPRRDLVVGDFVVVHGDEARDGQRREWISFTGLAPLTGYDPDSGDPLYDEHALVDLRLAEPVVTCELVDVVPVEQVVLTDDPIGGWRPRPAGEARRYLVGMDQMRYLDMFPGRILWLLRDATRLSNLQDRVSANVDANASASGGDRR